MDEFLELRTIGSGSNSIVYLFYHLKSEQLYAVKIHRNKDEKLFNREMKNLENIQHPFLPQFYGTIKNKWETFFVMEYIHGQTLENIKNQHLGICAKLKIIIEIIYIIKFLHENNLIYRDLKPSNVMLDIYHHAILIDFDRLIDNNLADNEDHTKDFNHCFIAPEIVSESPQKSSQSKKSDIYSIGKMIGYIITEIDDHFFFLTRPKKHFRLKLAIYFFNRNILYTILINTMHMFCLLIYCFNIYYFK